MADSLNPLAQIKHSCALVSSLATHVKIDADKIADFATILEQDCSYSSWDADGWHFNDDAAALGPHTCQYIFVLDCLNFCFWPCPELEYEQLACALTKVIRTDPRAFDADRLQALTKDDIARWFTGYEVPLLEERVDRLRELGAALAASMLHVTGESFEYSWLIVYCRIL